MILYHLKGRLGMAFTAVIWTNQEQVIRSMVMSYVRNPTLFAFIAALV
jgi:hypothetical protein